MSMSKYASSADYRRAHMTDAERLKDIRIALNGVPEAMESAVFMLNPQGEYWIKAVRQALKLASPDAASQGSAKENK